MTNSIVTVGTIEHIDPNLIVVEANVRTEAALGRDGFLRPFAPADTGSVTVSRS